MLYPLSYAGVSIQIRAKERETARLRRGIHPARRMNYHDIFSRKERLLPRKTGAPWLEIRSEILLYTLGDVSRVVRDDNREADAVNLAKFGAPVKERLQPGRVGLPGHAVETVDEDVGDIKVARVQAADKSL